MRQSIMNFLRGLFLIGVIIGCFLSWYRVETDHSIHSLSGLTWVPVTVLLSLSILTLGYTFYNGYRKSTKGSWTYLVCGLYGIGVCFYIYLLIGSNMNYIIKFLHDRLPYEYTITSGPGLLHTGLFSFLLFLTGFDRSEKKRQATMTNM
jgi:hypothetical protein